MKRILSLMIAVLILAMSFMASPVSAEFGANDISIEPDVYKIKVTVMSEKPGVMTAMLTNTAKSILYGKSSDRTPEVVTNGNITEYKYEFSFKMRTHVPTGTYVVTVGNNVDVTEKTFSYVRIDDKIEFYGNLEGTPIEGIKNYISTSTNVPVDTSVLDVYKSIADEGVLGLINAEIDKLLLDPTIIPEEGKTETELKIEKIQELDAIFIPKFTELMELAQVALVNENGWQALTADMLGNTFDDYFYDTVKDTSYFYTNPETALNADDIFEKYVAERAQAEEFTLAEYAKAFDRATLMHIEQTRSFGVLKDAFIYYENKGSIAPDMANIQAIVDSGDDFEFWQKLAEKENTDSETLIENAEELAKTNTSGGENNDSLGGTSTPADKPNIGGGGSLGGGGGSTKPTTPAEPEPETPKVTFKDIDTVEWAKESIEALAEKGVLNGRGDGKFYPDDAVTREEFVKTIIGAFDLLNEDASADFDDVDASRWSYAFIATANELGIVTGDGASFNPTGEMSRQDMAVVIYRTAQKLGLELSEEAESFTDADDIADYAKSAVTSLTASGIINGMGDGTFAPKSTVTRAQAAKVIYGLMNIYGGGK